MRIHTLTAALLVALLSPSLGASRAAAQWTACPEPRPTVVHAVATSTTESPAAAYYTADNASDARGVSSVLHRPVRSTSATGPRVTLTPVAPAPAAVMPAAYTTYKPAVGTTVEPCASCGAPSSGVLSPPRISVPQACIPYPQTGYSSVERTYALRPVLPVVPMPSQYFVGRGSLGQPKVYASNQPVRNFLRYLWP